jgi:hypothetical protein
VCVWGGGGGGLKTEEKGTKRVGGWLGEWVCQVVSHLWTWFWTAIALTAQLSTMPVDSKM